MTSEHTTTGPDEATRDRMMKAHDRRTASTNPNYWQRPFDPQAPESLTNLDPNHDKTADPFANIPGC